MAISLAPACAQNENQLEQRKLTLSQVLELALQNNLDLQIERFNPELALYSLNEAKAAYDPTFNFSGEHQKDEAGSRLLGGGFSIPGSVSDADALSTGFGGLLPWGLRYNLEGSARDTYGHSYAINTNGALQQLPFESTLSAVTLRMTQPLLKNFFMDSARLNIRVAKVQLKSSQEGFRQRVMQTVNTAEQAYYNLIAARESVLVQQKAVELADRLLAENKKRVEVGAMAPLDERQAESQAASSRADMITAQNQVAILADVLKSLITDEYRTYAKIEIIPADALSAEKQFFNRQDSWSKGLTMRPDLQQAKFEVERAGIQLKYDRNQLLPQVDLFGTFGYNGSGNEFSDAFGEISGRERPFYGFGGLITIPIGNRAARNRYQASRTVQEQTVLALKRLEQQVMVEVDNAINEAQSSFQRVAATRAAREFAGEALEAEQKKLESGKSTSFQVLRLQRDLTTARSDEIKALTDYNKALARLRFNEGSTLQYRGINIQAE